MRVFLNTDVLISLAGSDPESSGFLNVINTSSDCSFWISAASISKVHDSLSKRWVPQSTRDHLNYIQYNFSMIPLRQAILTAALEKKHTDFDTAVQIASAEAFHMDYMVTHSVDRIKDTYIQSVTPEWFIKNMRSADLDMVSRVPFLYLKAQQHQIYNEIDDKLTDIISNTGFILGKHVEEFEQRFAEIQEAKYCIGVSSGTDALHIALTALGISPGDAVMVPVNTFIATAEAVSLCGAVPVFVDCDRYYNMDVKKLREFLRLRSEGRETPVKFAPVRSPGPTPVKQKKILVSLGRRGKLCSASSKHLTGQAEEERRRTMDDGRWKEGRGQSATQTADKREEEIEYRR